MDSRLKDSILLSGDSACGLESGISSPSSRDSHSRLISACGLKTSEAVQGGGTQAGFFRMPRILEEEIESKWKIKLKS